MGKLQTFSLQRERSGSDKSTNKLSVFILLTSVLFELFVMKIYYFCSLTKKKTKETKISWNSFILLPGIGVYETDTLTLGLLELLDTQHFTWPSVASVFVFSILRGQVLFVHACISGVQLVHSILSYCYCFIETVSTL